jgi:two-component system chemotaxis family response regulator WspR
MREIERHETAGDGFPPDGPPPVRVERAVVLLVDDQPIIGEAIRRMLLDQPGIEFHYCPTASLAVETAERVLPTVILQDLVMPDVDGLTLVGRYRASATVKDTPVIVLSSKEDPAVKRDAFQGGANDYLVKLPDKIELVARIRLHSKAFLTQIERDKAYQHLNESQRQLVDSNRELADRIQELQATRDELARMVSTDALTGLHSRRHWFELAAAELTRSRRYRRPLSFLMADLDLFKRINDTYGHEIGDEVIRQFARVLRTVCRESDFAGRVGGEEFAVLLPETPIDGAEEVARRIVTTCRGVEVTTAIGPLTFSCSIGVTTTVESDCTVEDGLRRADAALYETKRGGRDGWRSSPGEPVLTMPRS